MLYEAWGVSAPQDMHGTMWQNLCKAAAAMCCRDAKNSEQTVACTSSMQLPG